MAAIMTVHAATYSAPSARVGANGMLMPAMSSACIPDDRIWIHAAAVISKRTT